MGSQDVRNNSRVLCTLLGAVVTFLRLLDQQLAAERRSEDGII